jgi:hypothetical protein
MNPQKNELIQKFANVILQKKEESMPPYSAFVGSWGFRPGPKRLGRCPVCAVAEDGTLTPAWKPVPAPLPANITIAAGEVRSTLCKNRIDA